METGKYVAQLDKNECSYLRMFIGQTLSSVFTSSIHIHHIEYESMDFCFSLGSKEKEWINLTNSWLETPNDASYYKIGVALAEKPLRIELTKEGGLLNASSIFIGGTITKIEIYSKEEVVFGDTVLYDNALIFYCDKGEKFCISAIEAIRDSLNFTFDEEVINTEIMGSCLRQTLV